jgi:ABC-2 type transport system ATP-binding protein
VTVAIETESLGRRYRKQWALFDCSLSIPSGSVVGLVGPNGAGKTTLLHLVVGLLKASSGTLLVLGDPPALALPRIGFVAQDLPVYPRLTVMQHLRMGDWLNPTWDHDFALGRLDALGLDPRQRAGTLSGGQRAQISLTMALAKRPELLVLDEPVASLDPLARREFLQTLMEVVAARGVTVLLSSHLIGDIERVCDHLILLVAGRVALSGEVDDLLSSHRHLTGPRRDDGRLPATQKIIESSHVDRQSTLLVYAAQPILDPAWTVTPVTLDDLVLAYMRQARDTSPRPSLEVAR